MTVLCHTHPLVVQLENTLLPLFRAALPPICLAAPQVLASVFAFSSGSAAAFEAYHFGISCLLDDVADDAAQEVALLVIVSELDSHAQLSAQVAWGPPSGKVEAQAALTENSMTALLAALPTLLSALNQAVSRA